MAVLRAPAADAADAAAASSLTTSMTTAVSRILMRVMRHGLQYANFIQTASNISLMFSDECARVGRDRGRGFFFAQQFEEWITKAQKNALIRNF